MARLWLKLSSTCPITGKTTSADSHAIPLRPSTSLPLPARIWARFRLAYLNSVFRPSRLKILSPTMSPNATVHLEQQALSHTYEASALVYPIHILHPLHRTSFANIGTHILAYIFGVAQTLVIMPVVYFTKFLAKDAEHRPAGPESEPARTDYTLTGNQCYYGDGEGGPLKAARTPKIVPRQAGDLYVVGRVPAVLPTRPKPTRPTSPREHEPVHVFNPFVTAHREALEDERRAEAEERERKAGQAEGEREERERQGQTAHEKMAWETQMMDEAMAREEQACQHCAEQERLYVRPMHVQRQDSLPFSYLVRVDQPGQLPGEGILPPPAYGRPTANVQQYYTPVQAPVNAVPPRESSK
ncbi:hypothetical protein BOTBODRAFT_193167 [Botryobasidium botryosum FD-172 SS1]|uniref:Uncharacterized protein n=1 Tax=Botryobasidium botryosum (strain FD-172 SS1) TaxID=930990 RepID=A0A067M3N5_BOTB1|nr:hypothetical protein BOTBODRAFT_193167 [Botryobasidium botryosum FD-172 SS1]